MSVLDQQSKLNGSAALYAPASGGGGGGGGPVLNVSTINFNSVGSAGNVPAQQNMRNGGDGAGGLGAFNGAVLAFDMDPGPVSTMLFGYNSANNALQITQSTDDNLTSGALQVDAIFCSTINGAVPGGGGGGPNPIFSTITLNVDANTNNLYTTEGVFVTTVTDSNDRLAVYGGDGGSSTPGTGRQMGIQSYFSNGAQGSILFGNANGNESALTLINYDASSFVGGNLSTVIYGGVQILPGAATGSSLYTTSTNTQVVNIEDFNNPGQFPYRLRANSGSARVEKQDGSLGDLSVSTLTVSTMNTIAVLDSFTFADTANTTQGATLQLQPTDPNLFSFQVLDSNAALVQGLNIGLIGSRNQVYINSNAQIQNDLWVSSISQCALANVSSLNVSSINGATPSGGGSSATRVALNGADVNNNISVPGAMTPGAFQQVSAGYSVVANNTYRMTAVVDLSGTVDGQFALVIYGGGIGGLPETVWQFPNDNTVKGQGVSCTFRVGNTGTVYVGAENTATNASDSVLITVGAALWVFENLGALG